ncbi:uncharacterized protein LOC144548652 isoform X2 [Carex rostrata]
MATNGRKKRGTFEGTTVYLSRNLVAPEIYSTLYDALRLNGADIRPCCDPSKNSPLDFHVISSADHERFADLRAKGCNLLGPQCVLSCAKEHRVLPKQGYTCCLAMDGVKVIALGFGNDEKARIQERVSAMGGLSLDKLSLDIDFAIVKNVLASKYKWALNNLKKPIISITWLDQCWMEHRIVPHEPYRVLPFTGLTICVTKIHIDERRQMGKMIVENGGQYSADLTKKCTHLVSDGVGGDKYTVAKKWGNIHIVNRRWIDMCIARRACLDEAAYPVTNNTPSRTSSANCSQKEKQCQHQEYKTDTIAQHVQAATKTIELSESGLSQDDSASVPCMVFDELDKEKKATLKKSSSKLSVKRKHDDINSEEKKGKNSTNPIEEGLKNVNESMAEIARALNEANKRLDRSTIRIYSSTEIYDELEKLGVPDDKLLDAAYFLKTNNEKADTFFCCPERLKRQWLERNGF